MKYFVVSDIHSFAEELKWALWNAGFRKNNKEHTLIIVGDIFDRGESAWDTYKYIKSIPKKRRILIRGNHEALYLKLLNKDYPDMHDFSNKTVDTFCQVANMTHFDDISDASVTVSEFLASSAEVYYESSYGALSYIDEDCQQLWNEIREKVKNSEITKFLQSKEWKNFYELDKFIFVHSFIPLRDNNKQSLPAYYLKGHQYEYRQDWRNCSNEEWIEASWGCPWQLYNSGLFDEEIKNGKVLVCGHWHTGDFYAHLDDNFEFYQSVGPIYYKKNLIGLDGGVQRLAFYGYTHPQNVLIIDENFNCYDKFLNKLNEGEK